MEDYKLILILAGILAAAGILFFLLGSQAPECTVEVPSTGYVYGLGEGIAKDLNEAKKKAMSSALDDLTSKLIVYVESEKELAKHVILVGDKRSESEELKVKVDLKTAIEVANYKTKECFVKNKGNYVVKTAVYMPELYAKNIVKAYAYARVIEKLYEAKMIFTAYDLSEKLKVITTAISPVPKAIAESAAVIAEVEKKYMEARSIINELEKLDVYTPEDYMEYVMNLQKLKKISAELPNKEDILMKIKSAPSVSVKIKGPEIVVKSQEVLLEITLDPAPVGSYNFDVQSEGLKTTKNILIEDGYGRIQGVVTDIPCSVEVNLAGILNGVWKPSAVYEPTYTGISKALLSGVAPLSYKVVFLPATLNEKDIALAMYLEKTAENFGWRVEKVSELSRKLDGWLKNFGELPKVDVNVVYARAGAGIFEITGTLRKTIKVERDSCAKPEVIKDPYIKAALVVGFTDLAKNTTEPLYKTLSALYDGDLGEAANYARYIKNTTLKRLLLSYIFYEQGRYKESINEAKKVVKDDPQKAYAIMIKAYKEVKDPLYLLEEIRDLYQVVTAIKDCDPGYYTLAYLLRRFGNYKEAAEWILKALDVNPNNPEYIIEYTKILIGLGRIEEAKKQLEKLKYLELTPSQKHEILELEEKLK